MKSTITESQLGIKSREFIGKDINKIKRVKFDKSVTTIPKIIFMLSTYLLQENRLKEEGILRLNGDLAKLDLIRHHLTLGDYAILKE